MRTVFVDDKVAADETSAVPGPLKPCRSSGGAICGFGKGRKMFEARNALTLTARRLGRATREHSHLTNFAVSTINRRHNMARAGDTDPNACPPAKAAQCYWRRRVAKSSKGEG